MPIRAIAPIAAAVALSLSSQSAIAAELKPAELLEQAKAEQSAYIETVKQLVAVDTGTGQAKGQAPVSQMGVAPQQALGAEVSPSPAPP
jgi:glutamate carboxypeptidase